MRNIWYYSLMSLVVVVYLATVLGLFFWFTWLIVIAANAHVFAGVLTAVGAYHGMLLVAKQSENAVVSVHRNLKRSFCYD